MVLCLHLCAHAFTKEVCIQILCGIPVSSSRYLEAWSMCLSLHLFADACTKEVCIQILCRTPVSNSRYLESTSWFGIGTPLESWKLQPCRMCILIFWHLYQSTSRRIANCSHHLKLISIMYLCKDLGDHGSLNCDQLPFEFVLIYIHTCTHTMLHRHAAHNLLISRSLNVAISESLSILNVDTSCLDQVKQTIGKGNSKPRKKGWQTKLSWKTNWKTASKSSR